MKNLLFFALIIFGLFSCKKNSNQKKQVYFEVNPEHATYVSAFTSGLISKNSTIKVVLQNDFPIDSTKTNQLEDLFQFSPKIKGATSLENNTTLVFTPQEAMAQGQAFTANLNLNKFIPELPKDLKQFKFQFQVKNQNFTSTIYGLESIDEKQPEKYNLNGVVNTADVVKDSLLEKTLVAKLNGKSLPIQWKHSKDKLKHEFSIKNVNALNKVIPLMLKWNGQPISVDKSKEEQFEIPAVGTFKITKVNQYSNPEQYVEVNFSQSLNENQFYDGLVEIVDSENQSENLVKNFIVDGNQLKIYTNKKIGGDYLLKIHPGLSSKLNHKIDSEFEQEVSFKNLFPSVKFIGNGNIVPDSEGINVPFEAEGLNAVRVSITKVYEKNIHQFFQKNQYNSSDDMVLVGKKVLNQIIPLNQQKNFNSKQSNVYQLELSKFIEPEPGAIYNVQFSFDQSFASFPCDSTQVNQEFLTPLESQPDNYYSETDNNEYYYYNDYYYPDGFDWDERDNPCHVSYYTAERTVSRNILASNLGVIVKSGNDKKAHVTVSDLITTKSLENAKIEAYDLQNQLVGSGTTDSNGFATLELSRKPFLIVAKKNKQKAYVKVNDGSSLSLSNFAVDGQSYIDKLSGFIYGERGVWRPGDDIHLTFVLNNEYTNIPASQPAVLEFKNPDGQIMQKHVNNKPTNGFYTFSLNTAGSAKTGNWTANIKVGGLNFNKTIKIETIKPNRLKIESTYPAEILTQSSDNSYSIKAEWLSGAKAKNLLAKIDATVYSIPTNFKAFPNYIFDDPSRHFSSEEQTIFNQNLNENGTANIPLSLSESLDAPGMLKVGLFTKVFEAGGEFSSKYERKTYSPFSSYVGLNVETDGGYWEMLETGKEHTIPIATVDYLGNPLDKENIDVSVFKIENSWWYNADDNDLAYYVSRSYDYLYKEDKIETKNGRGSFTLNVPDDDWGNYFIRVCDSESGHCSGKRIWIDWPNWRSRGGIPNESASILSFTADKKEYKVGEKATISIPSSLEGRALVSFENGITALHRRWIETKSGETKFSFKITEEMAPNCYVSITMIQPHNATVNDLPIRMYGVIPISVENPERKITPIIKAPKEITPKSDYSIKVSEKNKKPMTYTLAVVDEGLLDITNFKTPNIYDHFNQKQALGVKTWDIYNYVLGAYGGRIESVFAIGGDQALSNSNKEKISRFKPVVQFLGPFTLEKGKENTHDLKMENYIGRVKVMVVAGDHGKYGSAEQSVFVRKPLMTLATLPRVLNPNDELEMPISVFAMDNKIKNVQVKVGINGQLELQDSAIKSLEFTETGEQIVNFKLKVPPKVGKAKVTVQVQSGNEVADQTIELEVRSPNPLISKTTNKELKGSENWVTEVKPFGVEGTNDVQIQFSSIPNMNLNERLHYLIRYPHGCVEQTTSSVFPQLFLADLIDLEEREKTRIQKNVTDGLKRLKSFQLSNGGLGYWQRSHSANEWGTNYAFHFILKAEEKGYNIPVGLKEGIIRYQKRKAKSWNEYYFDKDYADLTQIYRLFTLALSGNADLALMNRIKEKKLNSVARWRLASAYNVAGQKEIAQSLFKNLEIEESDYRFNHKTYGSGLRDQAIVLETLSILDERTIGNILLNRIANKLRSKNWYSTQTTAYCLLAVSEFIGTNSSNKNIRAELIVDGKKQIVNAVKSIATVTLPKNEHNVEVINKSDGLLFIELTSSGIPLNEELNSEQQNLNMKVEYVDLNNNPINVTNLTQGTDFKAVVTISNPGLLGTYNELALTQMFPSGWEIINTRVNNMATSNPNNFVEYQDYRDNRVYSYFDLNPVQEISITTLLNATYSGNYYLPATFCEAMYDNNIYALESGKRVSVVK